MGIVFGPGLQPQHSTPNPRRRRALLAVLEHLLRWIPQHQSGGLVNTLTPWLTFLPR
jgi:hypothetical protein